MMENYSFFEYLDEKNKKLVIKINNHEILGASQHLDILSDMFIDIVEMNKELSVLELVNQINNMKDFYLKTRGSSSRAIVNGLARLLLNVNKELSSTEKLFEVLESNKKDFREENDKNMVKILEYSNNELKDSKNILLYDYSSTVEKAIKTLLENNTTIRYNIFIAESSAIDGGSPFLPLNKYKNAKLYFFPDATLAYYVAISDSCLMGAETFYADGTGFNTIGSDIVAILCEEYQVPLYFITPMNKLDIRRLQGIKKEPVTTDYKQKYKFSEKLESDVETVIPELVDVPRERIFAYITEHGIIPSDQLFIYSLEYSKALEGGV